MSNLGERIAVIGLGYVGLPIAVSLANKFEWVLGFDISDRRIRELVAGHDRTNEIEDSDLQSATLRYSADPDDLADATFFIVTVPTPIDAENRPDLSPLQSACELIGPRLTRGSVVVFESTVYPGVSEEFCAPILERISGLTRGSDFTIGYSPERINPGDKEHRLETIVKVIAAEDEVTLDRLYRVYGSIVTAGLHRAPTIKVAEAAKVIENTQRDINIALMNELALILDRMNIRTKDVLDAAGTKWNFLRFSPGLVGGHCIGVDPYYLTHKAQALGYDPQVILSGRRINDGMGMLVAERTHTLIGAPERCRVGIFGLTFKENVPDLRNSKVPDIIERLRQLGAEVFVHDPYADAAEADHEYALSLTEMDLIDHLDAAIIAVPHAVYAEQIYTILDKVRTDGAVIDVRSLVEPKQLRSDLTYWSL